MTHSSTAIEWRCGSCGERGWVEQRRHVGQTMLTHLAHCPACDPYLHRPLWKMVDVHYECVWTINDGQAKDWGWRPFENPHRREAR